MVWEQALELGVVTRYSIHCAWYRIRGWPARRSISPSLLYRSVRFIEGKGNFDLMRSLEVIWTAEASVSEAEGRFKP